MQNSTTNAVSLPLDTRVRMAHALIAVIAEHAGLDILHVKGYAAPSGFYHAHRVSTDADILIRPSQAGTLVEILRQQGWTLVTSFRSGSIFRHAAALWHETWGYVDVHRSFPGIGIDEERSFDRLWQHRDSTTIAHKECNVPSSLDHAFLIVIHAARDAQRGQSDMNFLRAFLAQDWSSVEARSFEFKSRTPFVIAASSPDEHHQIASNSEYKLWISLSQGSDRVALLKGRLEATGSTREKLRILLGSLVVNRDHLQMQLGRPATTKDFLLELMNRAKEPVKVISHRLMRSGKHE